MLDDLSRVLRFKPHLLVLDAGPETLFVVDEFKRAMLSGAIFVRIAACLRGRMTIAEIVTSLAGTFGEWDVLARLDHLVRRGYVRADPPHGDDAARGYFERAGLDGDAACARVAQLRVAVETFGADGAPLRRALDTAGIGIAKEAELTVAIVDTHDRDDLAACAARVAARGGALLVVAAGGVQTLIGPLLADGVDALADAPCVECVRYWIRVNRPVEALLARHHGRDATHVPPAASRAGAAAAAALVAATVEQIAVNRAVAERLQTHIVAQRLDTLTVERHRVVRRPQCPCCGHPLWMREQAARAPRLAAPAPLARADGGYRTADPQQVFARHAHLISPVSGAIAYLHPMPKRHAGLRKVYASGFLVCPAAVPDSNRFDRLCSGKGRTDEQARTSALCEALERFSSVYQGDEATVTGSIDGLRADPACDAEPIHVNALQQFSERQFDARDAINALTRDVRKQVPPRFTSRDVIDWTPAWSLVDGRRRLVPLSYCYAETPDSARAPAACVHNPNGCAAGSSLDEAMLQGMLELIERDAVAIWWYNRIERPGIELASFADPYFDALVHEYATFGWRVWALDITTDLTVPTVAALAENLQDGRFSIGFGCHPDGRIAVQRALTEVNQLLDIAADAPDPWDRDMLSSTRFLYPAPGTPATTHSTWQPLDIASLPAAIAHCVGRIAAAGMDVLVVDKTRPDIGLSVVQVIAPGLCHFWPRFGARRLYSVPVALGWRARPCDETALNPALLFL
ncbi:TOMM precursor leader peptide-binding protein [Burkholderia cenocepacia]|uniref:TOMM precursor leader peptide-binding protein n=1 Tax=Burkholderia cenocepacia TaxID=95486 RepID=UPI00196B7B70|nr:TOMM precursor leader peptide-binding protein [Burkholderia cenocepacia]MBN3530748.1 TOMM precursor leader peptide-binding protein [Burkholderia cenocepacia]MBO1858170.1 TOMM precursor leader peptide-binding protein [Burkholderia cenocepacia]MBR8025848.1 TOMM precursor leader peptide-binding protein [Burkholderia cenocepacia]MBR8168334.1 TOMM precursor leader peptide-binding protein [Burkholderia cenocepacia]MBR8423313.1 TOMM precursor leader peptide-binding protein [Burkholderia cenocepaci